MELRENEARVLKALERHDGRASLPILLEDTNLDHAAVMRAVMSLGELGYASSSASEETVCSLTDEGRDYARIGLPERRLVSAVRQLGGRASLEDAAARAGVPDDLITATLGWVRRKGWGGVRSEQAGSLVEVEVEPPTDSDEAALRILSQHPELDEKEIPEDLHNALDTLARRNLVVLRKRSEREVMLTEAGRSFAKAGIVVAEEISELSPELIVSGRWKKVKLRKYNISADVIASWPGKKQPYKKFLDELKQKLVALGFREMTGPTVELMFFNCDVLYMPQDHPARDIHDIYFVRDPANGDLTKYGRYLPLVRAAHESGWKTGSTGWRYKYSYEIAKRLVLRSQGTPLSARTLVSPELQIPGKYFSIARCYRPDAVDSMHLTEFNQVEGIVVAPDLTLRDLLGVLERFAIDVAGADRVKYIPDYFPFTEPSVQLSAYKEGYGWVEFGGSGIFRPEMTKPLGIDVPVIAWGLGVDRLFMMKAGINDIRTLFTHDIAWLRQQRVL